MTIDIKRLEADLDYWNEVAPEGATHYGPECKDWLEAWYKKKESGGWSVVMGNFYENYIAKSEAERRTLIPRPSPAWNGEGLPPVGVECVATVRDHKSARDLAPVEVKIEFIDDNGVFMSGDDLKGGCIGLPHKMVSFSPIHAEKECDIDATKADDSTPCQDPAWNGEGLPPAGVECELALDGSNRGVIAVTITYMGDGVFCYKDSNEVEATGALYCAEFGPLKTEKERVCEYWMDKIAPNGRYVLELIQDLYDAGALNDASNEE